MISKTGVKYLIVGISNTTVTLLTIIILVNIFKINDYFSNAFGYAAGVIFGYLANKNWTFNCESDGLRIFGKYLIVLLVAYLINISTVYFFLQILKVNSTTAHLAGMPIYTTIGYLGNKFYTFNKITNGIKK